MKRFQNFSEIAGFVGQSLHSEWVAVSQAQIDLFAQATGDHQWIHTDPGRAKAGPFGGTIAHGFLTLSLMPVFFESAFAVDGVGMGVNYGLNKVRFTAPVPSGSRLRAQMTLKSCEPIEGGGVQMAWSVVIEREGGDKPVCVAEPLLRYHP